MKYATTYIDMEAILHICSTEFLVTRNYVNLRYNENVQKITNATIGSNKSKSNKEPIMCTYSARTFVLINYLAKKLYSRVILGTLKW